MPGSLLTNATTNGTQTASPPTVTGGTTLLLSGTLGRAANVLIEIASAAGPFVPFENMNAGGKRTCAVNLGNAAAEARLRATLQGVNADDGTNCTLEYL